MAATIETIKTLNKLQVNINMDLLLILRAIKHQRA